MSLRARPLGREADVRRMDMRAVVALVCLLESCSSGTRPQAGSTMPPPSVVEPPSPSVASRSGCIEVSIGLDFRALPTDASPAARDMFVRGEIDDFRRGVAQGVPVEMWRLPGSGTFTARFPSSDQAACDASVATYLADAPQLPLLDAGPAARVSVPCGSCS